MKVVSENPLFATFLLVFLSYPNESAFVYTFITATSVLMVVK